MEPIHAHSDSPKSQRIISIVAGVICRNGETLLVRKRGTVVFMQPGGKLETGETPRTALLRELREELGLVLDPSALHYLGAATAPAANEPGWLVQAELFRADITGDVRAGAEIEELLWLTPASSPAFKIAPLTRDHVFPLLA